MANAGEILAIVGTATAINSVAAMREGEPESAFGVIFGGLAMTTTLAGLGQFYDWKLARNFALLFLLGSLLFRGEAFFKWFSLAVGSAGNPTSSPNNKMPRKKPFKG